MTLSLAKAARTEVRAVKTKIASALRNSGEVVLGAKGGPVLAGPTRAIPAALPLNLMS